MRSRSTDPTGLQRECVILDDFVTRFIQTLPVNPQSRDELVTAALAHVTLIQLHIHLADTERKSRDACVAAARATLATAQSMQLAHIGFIDPIMAVSTVFSFQTRSTLTNLRILQTLLATAGQVFVQEVAKVKGSSSNAILPDAYIDELNAAIGHVLAVMGEFSAALPIMGSFSTFFEV